MASTFELGKAQVKRQSRCLTRVKLNQTEFYLIFKIQNLIISKLNLYEIQVKETS